MCHPAVVSKDLRVTQEFAAAHVNDVRIDPLRGPELTPTATQSRRWLAKHPLLPAQAPQASRQPDQAMLRRQNSGGQRGAASSTMLTGPGGIDPALLNIGRVTLLGS
jgi:hypothetical protein